MKITLTGQTNGTGPFRLGVSKKIRDIFYGFSEITLELPDPDGETYTAFNVEIQPAFKRACPHFYDKKIADWITKRGESSWTYKGEKPPKYEAKVTGSRVRVLG